MRRSGAERTPFDYESFFQHKIQERKTNDIYRVFNIINRDASAFPEGLELTNGKRRIIVWCSNDVLGMSRHPKVKQAVQYVCHKLLFQSIVFDLKFDI